MVVARGRHTGGDFRHVPACRSPRQFGCVVAYSTFDGQVPPSSGFGRSAIPGAQVLCTDPAARRGGTAPLTPIFPSAPFAPGTTLGAAVTLLGVPRVDVATTWVMSPGAYDSACSDADGASVMQVTPRNGAPLLKPVPHADWGLHLTDANIALGDEIRLVERQFRAYEAEHAAK